VWEVVKGKADKARIAETEGKKIEERNDAKKEEERF